LEEEMASEAPAAAPMTRKDLETKIVALAWKDDEFRAKFLADPKAQFEEKLGTKLPDSLVMTAHAEDENHLHFVIPAKPKELEELSDEDLEKIAGGTDVVAAIISGTFALSAAIIGGSAAVAAGGIQKGW
jgi:hypothetical protein